MGRPSPRFPPGWRSPSAAIDWLVALGFAVAAEIEAGLAHGASTANASTYLSAGAIALALAWRRRAPLVAVGVAAAALVVQAPLENGIPDMGVPWIALLFLLGSVGFTAEMRPAITCLVIAIGGYWIAIVIAPPGETSDWYFTPAVIAGAWGLGRAFRNRRLAAQFLSDRADRLEREQEQRARLAVADERSRIARELHDIVAHNVSTMIIQAGAGGRVVERDPARAGEAFGAIEKAGRQALAEMRRLLGILRTDRDGLSLAPQPSLTQLDALLDRVREAGLPVELTVVGEPRELAPGVDVTAYRIIQEGLTNAIKHAGKAHAQVVVRYGERDLGIEVLDDGRGPDGAAAAGAGGHGLIGMRERVTLYRGSLETGSRKDGGYSVQARIPVEPSAS